jgi:hypothetical protein
VHVFQFLSPLFRAVDVEVVISPLPEAAQFAGCVWEVQRELALGPAFPGTHRARHPLLQDLDKLRQISLAGLAEEQVHVLRHHHISNEKRSAAVTHFSQSLQEQSASPDGAQERSSLVATEGDEMQVSMSMMAFEFSGLEEKNVPTLSKNRKVWGTLALLLPSELWKWDSPIVG